jgi:TolB-like protein/Flp pilus assembly protein TadD/DNA-binding winged helix-turn-helix (wHTH) protein
MRDGFRLAGAIVDPATGIVAGGEGTTCLSPRALDALLLLARHPGDIVAREVLLQCLWPEGGHHDDALSKCIGEVRHALGDHGRTHSIIDTVPRHGYRLLIAPDSLNAEDKARLDQAAREMQASRQGSTHGWSEILLVSDRRQRLLRVAGAYAAASWAIMQVADVTFERLGLPERGVTFVIVLALLGFPIAVALAWFYQPARTVSRSRATPMALATSALILVAGLSAAAYFIAERLRSTDAEEVRAIANRSIAVLPFVNMSSDPANDYLGDGLAEELSTQLARLPDLQVASRTSAFTFRGSDHDIETIANALGVRHVLEGSVRRQGDMIRVTAQLIDASNGYHLWANTFDRELEDMFAIEDSISSSVVEALKIVLSPATRARLLARPTGSPGAYDLYLRGRGQLRLPSSVGTIEAAERLFREALDSDPAFAQAYAGLCEVGVLRYVLLKSAEAVRAAENDCAQAARLDSGQTDVHMALGKLYLATGQYVAAETQYRLAQEASPQDPHAVIGVADALAGAGKSAEAEATYVSAIRLRPRYWRTYDGYGGYLFRVGRGREAAEQYRRVTELAPDSAGAWNNLGAAYFVLGRFQEAADAFRQSVDIAPTSEGFSNTGTMYYYAGNYEEAARMFQEATRLSPEDYVMWGNLGDAYLASTGSLSDSEAAYMRAEELARATLRVNADDVLCRTLLSYFSIRLGKRETGRAELERAKPDASMNPYVHYYAALINGSLANNNEAMRHLKLAVDLGFPAAVLRTAPEMAPLRTDPRFPEVGGERTRGTTASAGGGRDG